VLCVARTFLVAILAFGTAVGRPITGAKVGAYQVESSNCGFALMHVASNWLLIRELISFLYTSDVVFHSVGGTLFKYSIYLINTIILANSKNLISSNQTHI
jgi:hypothetical protein